MSANASFAALGAVSVRPTSCGADVGFAESQFRSRRIPAQSPWLPSPTMAMLGVVSVVAPIPVPEIVVLARPFRYSFDLIAFDAW